MANELVGDASGSPSSELETEPRAARGRSARVGDLVGVVGLVAGLFSLYLSTYAAHGYVFPVGSDAPVYLWWARLAGHEGLSTAGDRPGVPGLTLVLGGTLGTGPVAILAALEIVLAVCVGLAAVALIRDGSSGRARWLAAGGFAGLFAVHLALGYVATLVVAALFVAAAAALASETRRAAAGAAALLGAAGLAHPQFLAIGVAVLLVTALPSLAHRGEARLLDTEHGRIGVAVGGGLALAGLGMVALLRGPAPMDVDTSRDDFLERSGLRSMLPHLFRRRLIEHSPDFAPLVSLLLVPIGIADASGFVGRFLRAWVVVLAVGTAAAFATGLFPAERLVTFAFVLPIAAGLGLVLLCRWLVGSSDTSRGARLWRAALGTAVAAGLVAAFAFPALRAWLRTPPKIFPLEVERTTEAGRYASASPRGTRLVFTAAGRQPVASFFLTEAANAIRATVPPDRIRDVRVVLPAGLEPMATATDEGRRLVRLYDRLAFGDLAPGQPVLWFDLAPFDRTGFGQPFRGPDGAVLRPVGVGQGVAIVGPHPAPTPEPFDPLVASSPGGIAVTSVEVLLLLGVAGSGWSRLTLGGGLSSVVLAPAFGACGMILGGIALERLGLPLTGRGGPTIVSGVVALGGYAAAFLMDRAHWRPAGAG